MATNIPPQARAALSGLGNAASQTAILPPPAARPLLGPAFTQAAMPVAAPVGGTAQATANTAPLTQQIIVTTKAYQEHYQQVKLATIAIGTFAETITRNARANSQVERPGLRTDFAGVNQQKNQERPQSGSSESGGGIGSALSVMGGAATMAAASIKGMVLATTNYVEALNPAAVMVFNQVVGDLTAVIGAGLQPALQVATSVTRDFANTLYPIMRRVEPVVLQVSQAVGDVARTLTNTFAVVANALAPVVRFAADAMSALVPYIQGATAAFSGLVEVTSVLVRGTLGSMGVDATSAMKTFADAVKELTKAMLVLQTRIWSWISTDLAKAYADGVIKALTGQGVAKPDTTGIQAAKNANITDIQSFGRNVSQAALLAGPKGAEQGKTEKQWLEEVAKQVKQAADGQTTQVEKAIEDFWNRKKQEIKEMIRDAIMGDSLTYDRAKDAAALAIAGPLGYLFRPDTTYGTGKLGGK